MATFPYYLIRWCHFNILLEKTSKNGELVVEWLKVELENTSAGERESATILRSRLKCTIFFSSPTDSLVSTKERCA